MNNIDNRIPKKLQLHSRHIHDKLLVQIYALLVIVVIIMLQYMWFKFWKSTASK